MCKRKRPKYKVGDILERWYTNGPDVDLYMIVGMEFYIDDRQDPWDYALKPVSFIEETHSMSTRLVDKFLKFRRVA